jgi:hypothetical protein
MTREALRVAFAGDSVGTDADKDTDMEEKAA